MRAVAIGFALALALAPGSVFAQAGPPSGTGGPPPSAGAGGPPPPGAISREQYIDQAQQRAAKLAGARFDQIDVNHTGYITRAQIRAFAAARRGGAAGGPPPGPGGPPPQQ
jgi:hypothetical protein